MGIDISGAGSFTAAQPQSGRQWTIGAGHFDSGYGADIIGSIGSSNKDTGNVGMVYYNAYGTTCQSAIARYSASVPLSCTHDDGFNTTCTTSLPWTLTILGYS